MKLLVIRFSALGDVTMTHPVIRRAIELNPKVEIHFLTRKNFSFIMDSIPGVKVLGHEFDPGIRGFVQLVRICFSLRMESYDAVVDLHGNLRSACIGWFLRMSGIPVFKIDKGRKEKKKYIGTQPQSRMTLRHHYLRYADVFRAAGVDLPEEIESYETVRWPEDPVQEKELGRLIDEHGWRGRPLIGLAAFARHIWKEYPAEKSENLLKKILDEADSESLIFLIGGGDRENQIMEQWQSLYPDRIKLLHAYMPLRLQVRFFSRLSVLMTMDSANLHLASLSGVPRIISVWGPTHADLGFGPSAGPRHTLVQIDPVQLSCRPCSVFGNKECSRGDHACMHMIDEQIIADEILNSVKGLSSGRS